ncbi:condensation domain-containing protein, partial [Streptomyces sp. 7-21]|uniref:condensation domain-containing protein n=1 Tax=Streptomyces sp. 7-21 TaxID=2802283 RepID=UPI00191D22E8
MSESQSGIWLAQRVEGTRRQYKVAQYLDITGRVDPAAFERALRATVAEAEALHVRFVEAGDEVWQVHAPAEWDLPVLDLRGEDGPFAAAEAWMRADLDRERTRDDEPLFSFALFRLADQRWIWYQRYDHLIMDGFGCTLMARRTAEHYTAALRGTAPRQAFGSLREALAEERDYHGSGRHEADRQYWLNRFGDHPELVAAPGQPATTGENALVLRSAGHLPPENVTALFQLARDIGVSWPRLIVAGAALLTSHLTAAPEVTLSLPVASRTTSLARRTPFQMANVLPLRLRVSGDMSFADLVRQAAREVDGLMRHQRYRGERLRTDLGWPHGDRWYFGPFVNIVQSGEVLRLGDSPAVIKDVSLRRVEEFSVLVGARPGSQGLSVELEPNTRRYDRAWAQSVHATLLHTLQAVARDPGVPLAKLQPAEPAQAERVLGWGTGDPGTRRGSVVRRVEAWARETPDAPAVVGFVGGEETELTYAELWERAGALAGVLAALGVEPERRVAVVMDRGPAWVVSLLAVWRAGGTYVPVDTAWPRERVALVLGETRPEVTVCGPGAGEDFSGRVVRVDEAGHVVDDSGAGAAARRAAPVVDTADDNA